MFDFGEQLPGMLDYTRQWGNYYGEVESRAQTEYQNRLARETIDRENRMNRDIGAGNLAAYQQRAGLFDNRNGDLYSLHRQNVSPVGARNTATSTTAPTELAGGPDGGPTPAAQPTAAPTPYQRDAIGSLSTLTPEQRAAGLTEDQVARLRASAGSQPASIRNLTPEQLDAWVDYVHATRTNPVAQRVSPNLNANSRPRPGVTPQVQQAALARLRATGLDIQNDTLVTAGNSGTPAAGLDGLPEQFDISGYGAPEVDGQADLTAVGAGNSTTTGAAQSGVNDPYYMGTNDTSRPMQMSREMELINTSIEDNMRNAQIYARYGRNDLAQNAFNTALAGQAAYLQQENILMLRAVAGGNMAAGAQLIGRLNGYPEGTVRLRPTDEARPRYILEVQDENNPNRWISAYEVPLTRDQLYQSLETAADAVSARARAETTQETQLALMENQRELTIASWREQNRLLQTMTEAQTSRYNAAQDRAARAGGSVTAMTDGNGGMLIYYPDIGQNGEIIRQAEWIHPGDIQTPSTNGENTTRPGLIRDRATAASGTVGVGAQR